MYKLIRLSDVLTLLPTDDIVGPKPSALRAAVEALPTVDAVEVVHGRWVADDMFENGKSSIFHCSECYYTKATAVLCTSRQLAIEDPHCKKCGAKMDGGAK